MGRGKICNNRKKGAITVFLAVIIMALIVFAGTVIDIVRIAAAERKVQSALNSSARSVLAGYDSELVGSYGVYGIHAGTETVRDEFYKYLCANLKERHEGVRFLDIRVDREDIEIHGIGSLLDDETFKRQVQEYMKYRVPVIVSQSLIEQLKNIRLDKKADFAKSERTTRQKGAELRTKVNEVNARLEGIKRKVKDLSADKLSELKDELSEALAASGSIYDENGKGLLSEYNESRENTNRKAEESECIGNQSREFDNIRKNSENVKPSLKKCLEEVGSTLQIVGPLQDQLKPLYKKLSDLQEKLSDLKDKLSDIREDGKASSGREEYLEDKIDEVEEDIDQVSDMIDELESRIEEEIAALKKKLGRFSLEGYQLQDESVHLAYRKAEELKTAIDRIKKGISDTLLRSLEKDWLIGSEEFERSSLITGEDFETMDEKACFDISMSEEDAEKQNDSIIGIMDKLIKAVEAAASGAAEKLGTIEYVMDKFTFLTSRTERNHYFKKGEVEYILCGKDIGDTASQMENTEYYIVLKVLLQVWALRFAIDTIDNFINSTVVFPPQRLAFALAEGALDSCLDMLNMLNGAEVPICPKSFTSVRLKYSDHLRILLLLKPEEEILRKARQLMQVNIKQLVDAGTGETRHDFRLGDYSTAIYASIEAKLNLFFLPMLKLDSLMPDRFSEGRYVIRKEIYVGY